MRVNEVLKYEAKSQLYDALKSLDADELEYALIEISKAQEAIRELLAQIRSNQS